MAGMKKLIEANKNLVTESKTKEQHHQKQMQKLHAVIHQTKSELSEALLQIQSVYTSITSFAVLSNNWVIVE